MLCGFGLSAQDVESSWQRLVLQPLASRASRNALFSASAFPLSFRSFPTARRSLACQRQKPVSSPPEPRLWCQLFTSAPLSLLDLSGHRAEKACESTSTAASNATNRARLDDYIHHQRQLITAPCKHVRKRSRLSCRPFVPAVNAPRGQLNITSVATTVVKLSSTSQPNAFRSGSCSAVLDDQPGQLQRRAVSHVVFQAGRLHRPASPILPVIPAGAVAHSPAVDPDWQ